MTEHERGPRLGGRYLWVADTTTPVAVFAAAPALLAACEQIAEICHVGIEGADALEERDEVWRIAQEAIAQARGEA